jgi:thiol:disulfide interchange protein DsbD
MMIPYDGQFFLPNKAKQKPKELDAIIYGIAIIFIYVVLGFLVTWILVPMP